MKIVAPGGGPSRRLRGEATILRADPDFCELDERGDPDHRPALVTIEVDD